MDIATHAITSLALARAFFPRRGWAVFAGMLVAGTLADVDAISALFSPSAYVAWHGTYTHSLLGILLIVAVATMVAATLKKKNAQTLSAIVWATSTAAIVHLLLDFCQSSGVTLLWPLLGKRFALDILPSVDAWIPALLILGLVVPEFFRLIGSEIGSKDKAPRGRNGAIVALVLILIYVGTRFILHASAVAELDAHSYHGESPRRVAAFADTLSLTTWDGIVETQSSICLLEAPAGPVRKFDAESASCQHKPEPSPVLDAAQRTAAAQKFLRIARFPKATVEKTQDGFEVEIRALEAAAEPKSWHSVAAQIILDVQPQVVSEKLVWSKDLGRR